MIHFALIQHCHLFAGLTESDIGLLSSIIKVRSCSRGEILFEEGEGATGFYVVATGKVKIYKLSPGGKERILHVIQPGNSFADAAIFADGCYPAFAETLTGAELYFFPKNDFLQLLHDHSQLSINMIAGLARYLRQFTTQIEDLTFRDVPARLARYLLSLDDHGKTSLSLPVAKAQLASNLGTTSETLSRTLRKLSDEEIIQVAGKKIEILDADRLYELSEGFRDE